jgi:cellulose synthase/poly-beta-1,6-N-acetylglucosamine synthase-like glycosyltransferase
MVHSIVIFLYLLTVLLLLYPSLVTLYYYYLLIAGKAAGKDFHKDARPSKVFRFAIVIPAHNEESGIIGTLFSCRALDYPDENFDVVVIADNCSDNTAELCRNFGVEVIERSDSDHRGKGYALEYAFSYLIEKSYEAFVIIDADCTLDKDALLTLSKELERGAQVAQLNNLVGNPDTNSMSYALAVGNYIENVFYYEMKSRLGLAVLLRGTGMMFSREVLIKYPWKAYSITEDIEYGVELLRNGIPVHFVVNSAVYSDFPEHADQLVIQRTRWAKGNLGFGKRKAYDLIIAGLRSKSLTLIDAGFGFLALSKPLIIVSTIIATFFSALCVALKQNEFTWLIFLSCLTLLFAQIVYFSSAILAFGISRKRFGLLLGAPATLMKLIIITLKNLIFKSSVGWERTPR